MLTLFKFSQLVIGQLVRTDVTVQTFQSLVKQNTLKISYVSEGGFSSFKTLITWYDRRICKKYRTMQEDLPTSYLLSSPCTQRMQDTKSKRLDIRTVFWVCDLKELFFSSWTPYNCQKEEQSAGSLPLNATDWICTHLWQMSNHEQKLLYSPCMQSPFTSFAETVKYGSHTSSSCLFHWDRWFFFNFISVSGLTSRHCNWTHIKHLC